MLYELFFPLSVQHTIFNLLRYITFRGIASFFTAFFIGVFIAPWFIKRLKHFKFRQSIREDGPESHQVKAGTPTMGGIFVIIAALISILLWARLNYYVIVVGLAIILFGGIGFMDDFLKIKQKNSKGVTAKLKLVLQTLSAFILVLILSLNPGNWQNNSFSLEIRDSQNEIIHSHPLSVEKQNSFTWQNEKNEYSVLIMMQDIFGGQTEFPVTNISINGVSSLAFDIQADDLSVSEKIPKNDATIVFSCSIQGDGLDNNPLIAEIVSPKQSNLFFSFFLPYYSRPIFVWHPILGFIFFIFTIVAFSNATNLSDGLDGLASGMGIMLYIPFGIFAYVMGNARAAGYLLFPFLSGAGEISIVVTAMIGGFTTFLWYNIHPAKVFMGDTGSLAMGGSIATIAIILKQEVLLVIAGAMFVVETLSVMIQVFCFKRFKRRVFKMTPIHHHFELSGWKETQVVVRFWILSALFALIALSALKIR